MLSSALRLEVASRNAAVSACEKAARWKEACYVLRLMRYNLLNPSMISYSAALCSCSKDRRWPEAVRLLP